MPCPLCQLQRVGLVAIGLGFMMNLRWGVRPSHYGVVLTGAVATRQVLLHVLPGDPGFGSAFLGLHFYTWAVVTAAGMTAVTAGLLMAGTQQAPAAPAAVTLNRSPSG
ncbi:TPA: disulfide bond formation protein B [Serratia marcescens]|nr:disulfide bond formation protein B [Serratia marcescens]